MDDFTLNPYGNLRLSLSLSLARSLSFVLNQKAIVIVRDVCCQHTHLSRSLSLSIVRIDPTPSVALPPPSFSLSSLNR